MKVSVNQGPKETTIGAYLTWQVLKMTREFLRKEGMVSAGIGIIFSDDRHLARLNSRYRDMESTTDVLSFPFLEKEEIELCRSGRQNFLGEVYISLERAREQAREENRPFKERLLLLVAHGLYHLLGYDHSTDDEESCMKRLEEDLLRTFI